MNYDRLAERVPLGDAGRPSRAVVAILRFVCWPIVRLAFRPTITGLEHLPTTGPFLLVSNHSGVLAIAELLSFAALYYDRFGLTRPLAGYAHPVAFHVPLLSWFMRGLGTVPSSYAAGEAVLARGIPLLVFPGGDVEAGRPLWRANTVDFGGRVGFLKLARKANVPIVPMGFRGSVFTAPVVWQSRLLAYLFVVPFLIRLKRFPLTLLALLGAVGIVFGLPQLGAWRWPLALAWLMSPLAMIPWIPWTVRARIGTPLFPEELFASEELSPALVTVESAVRELTMRWRRPPC